MTAIDVDRLIPDRGVTEIKIVAQRVSAEAREPTQQRNAPARDLDRIVMRSLGAAASGSRIW